jgi:hypothetical protein
VKLLDMRDADNRSREVTLLHQLRLQLRGVTQRDAQQTRTNHLHRHGLRAGAAGRVPVLRRSADRAPGNLDGQIATAKDKVRQNDDLVDRSKRAATHWREMVSGGLRKDASEAESIVTNNLREWAQEAGMNLTGLTPARPEKEKDFYRITIRATGTGRMSEISRFLYKIQNASIPVRISEMQISNRGKEGVDDLGIQMAISTVYVAPESEKRAAASGSFGQEVVR